MKDSIGFIAIGQGGGNIGSLFEKHGYNVLFINTSKEDLDTLQAAKHVHHIKNGEGCNKDRDKAKNLIIEDFAAISEQIKEKLNEEYIFVIFSAGGGTGSGASPMLIELLIQHTQKKVGTITILPAKTESLKAYINSYECFKELEDIHSTCATFILDNNKGDKLVINKSFVDLFNSFIEVSEHKSIRGNIDKAEIKEMLNAHGAALISKIGKDVSLTHKLIKSIKENIFAPIEADRVIKYIGLSAASHIDMEAVTKEVGACLDVFQNINPVYTVCMICGLTFPYTTLEEIRKRIEDNRECITKSLSATKESKLSGGINFLTNIQDEVAMAPKLNEKDIFSKYRRK